MNTRIPFSLHNHGSFEQEWGLHSKTSEWWYATGYLHNSEQWLYSYQYTLLSVRAFGLFTVYVLMLAITDFTTKKHYYTQRTSLSQRNIEVTNTEASWPGVATATKQQDALLLTANDSTFSYNLSLDYGKSAVWHCDNGALQMGLPNPRDTTLYYSYPNMPTSGTITIDGRTLEVTGKSWFDKQGGPYRLMRPSTHWEWFSLRFYDNEEAMLFSFPQSHHQDGTFIPRTGNAQQLTNYTITPTSFTKVNGVEFSSSWTLSMPGIKQESYTIAPIIEGQLNLAYFEQLCTITNNAGEEVGLCFVELLPGVRNKIINPFNMFRRVKS